jgi:hypothetical protein
MEEAPENVKELSHSAHANGMNEYIYIYIYDIMIYLLTAFGLSLGGNTHLHTNNT